MQSFGAFLGPHNTIMRLTVGISAQRLKEPPSRCA